MTGRKSVVDGVGHSDARLPMNEGSVFVRTVIGSLSVSMLLSGCSLILQWDPVKDRAPDAGAPPGGSGGDLPSGGSDAGLSGGGGTGGTSGTAGAGGDSASAFAITTTELPKAFFNITYMFQFAAIGGAGSSLVWSLESGALPGGLELTSSGTLQGVPTETGTFALSLLVRDGANGEARKTLNLTVSRKRWLAYTSDERSARQDLLYLVDTSSSLLEKILLSTNVPSGMSVTEFQFSPDGGKIAFLVGDAATLARDLYAVDLSADTPGAPMKVNWTGTTGQPISWSPTSSLLAFVADEQGTTRVRWADVSGAVPTTPPPVADGGQSPCWVTDQLLLWSLGPSVGYARLVQGIMDTPHEIALAWATCSSVVPSRERAYLGSLGGNRAVVDFASSLVVEHVPPYVSWDLWLFADPSNNAISVYDLRSLAAGQAPLASVTAAPINGWVKGGHRSYRMAWAEQADGSVMFTDASAFPLTLRRAGTQPADANNGAGLLAFSGDDSQLGWVGTDQRIWVATIGSTGPQEARAVSSSLASASNLISNFVFAPNSRSLAYTAPQDTADVSEVYVVDIAASDPSGPRKLNPDDATTLAQYDGPAWSSDSSQVGFVRHDMAVRNRLFVVDVLSTGAPAKPVLAACSQQGVCNGSTRFAFQP